MSLFPRARVGSYCASFLCPAFDPTIKELTACLLLPWLGKQAWQTPNTACNVGGRDTTTKRELLWLKSITWNSKNVSAET